MKINKFRHISIIMVIFANIFISMGIVLQKDTEDKVQRKLYMSANKYCNKLFINDMIKDTTTEKEINSCIVKLDKVEEAEKVINIKEECNKAISYIKLNTKINKYYSENIVSSDISEDDLNNLKSMNLKVAKKYQNKINERINDLENNYNSIKLTKNSIKALYADYNNKIVKENITRADYQQSLNLYNNLKQNDLKEKLKNDLDTVINTIENREKEEQERIKHQIAASWVTLNVPYISQNENNVMNGCEAASMLMALQYKGYLKNTTLPEYAEKMPKSNDPNTGFYLDIYGYEPTDISHWIAPEPLKNYGIESSGNNNIINATGYQLEQLGQEIEKGNPVVIYMTSMFKKPKNWSNGAPVNLHVQLLIGYNSMTGDVKILDPWKYKTKSSYWTLTKQEATSIYNEVGKRAVIIR